MCFGTIDREAIGMAIEALLADVVSRENCDQCKIDQVGVLEQQLAELRGDYETLKKAYEEALSAEAEWIPCSDRLPSEDGLYLIQTNYMYHDIPNMEVYYWAEGWNCTRLLNGIVKREYEIDGVVAWMPLPKPYRKNVEE